MAQFKLRSREIKKYHLAFKFTVHAIKEKQPIVLFFFLKPRPKQLNPRLLKQNKNFISTASFSERPRSCNSDTQVFIGNKTPDK